MMMMASPSTPAINGNNAVEKEPSAENGTSRFTAVNGKEPLTSGVGGSPSTNNERQREASENWRGSGYSTPFQQESLSQGYDDIGNNQEDAPSQQSPCHCDLPSVIRAKRRRSSTEEHQPTCQSSYRLSGASKALVSTRDGRADLGVPPSNASVTPASESDRPAKDASLSTQPPKTEDPQALSADSRWQEYKPRLVRTSQHAQQIDPSDAHLAEALQYEAGTSQKNPDIVKRPMEGLVPADQPVYSRERPPATVQVAPKRKRVFSNRTKTGCMTCRRRKKKCDEQHPTCNNCIRGGFLCEGYSSRGAFQKPSNPKTAAPLQSKEGYAEVTSQYIHDIGPQYGGQRSLIEHPDPGKMKSTVVDESDRVISQYNASPIDTSSNTGPWIKRSWTGPGHPAYISEHVAKSEIREIPLVHEISRGGRPKADYQSVVPLRESPYASKPTAPLLQTGVEQRPVHATGLGSNSPQTQARIALSIEQQLSEVTEKDKMLRGDLYQPFDIHLVAERNRCKAALWRFNNACNAIFGSSVKEQSRLLKEVLVPPASSTASSPPGALPSQAGGSIGQGAVIMAPFECHYGYNIHIGEDVMISEACRFIDDCHINVGAHTWIGPGVTILSSMAHPSMQERKGSQSRYQGRPVTIEEDCYVGANCTIYPGVRIRRGAYVAPGEVVKSDIVAYGFQGLKPSYM